MPKINQLSKLFHAVAAHDWRDAQAAASAIAEAEAKKGHHSAAARLRGALRPNGHRQEPSFQPGEAGNVARAVGTLMPVPTPESLSEVVLPREQRDELADLIREWRERARLSRHRVRRRSKVLLHGPPGCGKSMVARALAHETGLPAYFVRLDAVVGAFLGQTALRVREIFRFAETTPCVLLLDEIDALGRERGRDMDVGELDRVVISIMQQLEHSEPLGIFVATSNLPGRLDRALVRRFDLAIELPAPTRNERIAFGRGRARTHNVPLTKSVLQSFGSAKSYAEVERIVIDHKRRSLLAGK